jgi:aldehyde:ferredoxin oxidoreductase
MYGYFGQYAVINLEKQTVKQELLSEDILKKYIGGSGLNAYLLGKYVNPACDSLSAENTLIYSIGPYAGTLIPTSGRHQISAKSPLTGTIGEADVGGHWGAAFRNTGFDALVIQGKAPKPVYLSIENQKITFHDATFIWGKDTFVTTDRLTSLYGTKTQVSCIGPAGENQILIASILHDGRHARAAGRGGLGAVMGSKLLKAVVVSETSSLLPDIFNKESLRESARSVARIVAEKMKIFGQFGTVGTIEGAHYLGDVPIKNWQEGVYPESYENLSGQVMVESGVLKKRFFCKQCPIGCGRTIELSDKSLGAGPEYETMCMYGTNCLISSMDVVLQANEIANRSGFDTISSGSVISMLMEAYELGIVSENDLGGVKPEWGSENALLSLLTAIANNSEVGKLLGQGAYRVAEHFGCPDIAIHVKGLEVPAHDPRAFSSLGLSYATGNRGACHLQGMTYSFEKGLGLPERGFPGGEITRFDSERKPELTVYSQDWMSLCDSLKICKFSLFGGVTVTKASEWLNLITGWDFSSDDLLKAGERIYTLKRMFNVRAGFSRTDDTLPRRLRSSPKGGGAGDHLPPNLDDDLDIYYKIRGWDTQGIPTKEKLMELELLWI